MTFSKWDIRFLELAKSVSYWSKDPSTKVGAVITKYRQVMSIGYNGFSQYDKDENLEDRTNKLARTIHAEMNAILFAKADLDMPGIKLYTYPFLPCSNCASVISQIGISEVYSLKNTNPRWQESIDKGKDIFKNSGVSVYEYIGEIE
jgi:dCMP deaminase